MSSILKESNTLPNMEDKAMEFTLNILDAQFNHEGWYHLIFTLHNSFIKDYSEVQLMQGDSGVWEMNRKFQTDSTKQQENAPLSFFKKKKYTFRFPQGFFKNDRNHEVYLLVEAYSTASEGAGKGRKVGEGKFAIYPRPNAPRMKQHADPGEDYYHFTEVMSLLRTHSADNIQMHCGRIRNTYTLSEIVPPTQETPPPPTPPTNRSNEKRITPRTNRSNEKPTSTYSPKVASPKPSSPKVQSDRKTFSPKGQTGQTADRRQYSPKVQSPKQRDIYTPPKNQVKPTDQSQQRGRAVPSSASSWGDNLSLDLNLPKSPPLPPAADGKRIPDSPLPAEDQSNFTTTRSYRHVAAGGKEQVEVILHGASSIPMTPDGNVPQPFAVVKTKTAEDSGTKNGSVTHPSVRPTHSPSWEEMVTLDVDEKTAQDEVMVISVGDAQSRKSLVNYRIPVSSLTPFHQYHLELNMPAKGIPSGVKTFATMTRKLQRLPKDPSSPNYLALEVLLMNVQRPIKTPLGPLIAVARIVPDYYNYKNDNLLSHPRNAGVVMQNITFPSAHPSNFAVTERSHHGHPQLSLPGRPDTQPEWNHPYLFVEERDKATLFTPGAALVIEYYVASSAMSDQFWRMQSPVAFSSISMDEEMYKYLMEDRAKGGLRIDGVPMQPFINKGSDMQTVDNRRPTVGVILRLVTSEVPETMTSVSNLEDIPRLDLFPDSGVPGYYRADNSPDILRVDSQASQNGPAKTRYAPGHKPESPLSPARTPGTPPEKPHAANQGRYVLQKVRKRPLTPIKDGEMPPFTAMESVLPDYQYIFQPGEGDQTGRGPKPGPSSKPPDIYDGDEPVDKNSMVLLDHQSKELGNYRDAVHKMGGDILTLQNQIRELEGVNSNLRRDLASYNDASRLMVDSAELDGLTKPEVMSRYAAIKKTLSTQTADLKIYKEKLQHVQNELIKKNDQEKAFLKIKKAHASQQVAVQKLQDKLRKMKKLEEACKKQENVIQQMERVLEKHHRDRSRYQKDKASQDANEVLLSENKRLREQIDDLRIQIRQSGGNSGDDLEKMELYQALEKAEGRIAALENQLAQNSRTWGKERADLNLRLNEAEHGLGRSTGMVLHDYRVYDDIKPKSKSNLKRLSPMY